MPSDMRKDGSERGRLGYLDDEMDDCTGDPDSCWACSETCRFEFPENKSDNTDE